MIAAVVAAAGAAPAAFAAASSPDAAGSAPQGAVSSPKGFEVLPFPGTPDAAAATKVALPAVAPRQIASIEAVGSRSGLHTGRLSAQPAGHGSAFSPTRPFTPGEDVTVTTTLRSTAAATASGARNTRRLSWIFGVAQTAPASASTLYSDSSLAQAGTASTSSSALTHSFISAPNLHPPVVTMSGHDSDSASGEIFLDAQNSGQPAAYFMSSIGDLRWYQPSVKEGRGPSIFNLRVQGYQNRPVITYWRGRVVPPGVGEGQDFILGEHYRTIHTVTAGNGYAHQGTDLHEFTLGHEGSEGVAFVQIWSKVQHVDLRPVGGPANGTAMDWIIQEIDIATHKVVWEWHSLGHVPIADSYAKYVAGQPFDYFHLNSIQQLSDRHIIISARNTSTVYSINKATGKIDWRLGGKHSSFRMGPGSRFFWQHNATLHSGGLVTVFDDGAPPPEEKQSRALQIHIGTNTHQATLVRADTHSPSTLAFSQGSVQLLANRNVFVGWGSRPYFSEYTTAGRQIFSGAFRSPVQSYRAYRFNNWVGNPLQPPAIAVRKTSANHYNVYASWNGSTRVARWRVVASASQRGRFGWVGARGFAGFETRIALTTGDRWIKVEALDGHRRVLPHGESAAASAP